MWKLTNHFDSAEQLPERVKAVYPDIVLKTPVPQTNGKRDVNGNFKGTE